MLINLLLFSNIYLLCSSGRHEFCQKEYMNQYVDNYLRLYCFKRESSDGTVSTTTELEFESLSLSKLVVGCGEWELELVAIITATVSLSARFTSLWVWLGMSWLNSCYYSGIMPRSNCLLLCSK